MASIIGEQRVDVPDGSDSTRAPVPSPAQPTTGDRRRRRGFEAPVAPESHRTRSTSPSGNLPGTVLADMVLVILALVSGLSFLHYGAEILSEPRLEAEFSRYGLADFRGLVGVLELLGGAGVIVGVVFAPLGALAALGLSMLMLLGIVVRVRVRDAPRLMAPAALLCLLNAALAILFVSS